MSMKKVEQFFKLIEGNEVLAKRLAKINEELKSESEEFLNCEQAINEKIIPFAEENGISFTAKDFLDYTNSKLPPELTREDLLNVSGGVSPKTFAITLGALLTLPVASGSLMSFADDGIGGSAPQQTQTQAAAQNAADNEATEKKEYNKFGDKLWNFSTWSKIGKHIYREMEKARFKIDNLSNKEAALSEIKAYVDGAETKFNESSEEKKQYDKIKKAYDNYSIVNIASVFEDAEKEAEEAAKKETETPQEAEQKTFKYEPLYFSSHRSDESVKNNLVDFIIGNNIKSPDQIDNLLAFIDDASRVVPKIKVHNVAVSKDGTVKIGEKSYSFNGELQDSTQNPAFELISDIADKASANIVEEVPQKTFKYEQLSFSSHRSDESIKNNLVNFIIGNNIKSHDQIDNFLAFLDDASRVAPKIDISRNETYEDEKLYFFDKELQDSDQGSALELIKEVPQGVKSAVKNYYTPLSVKEENEGEKNPDEKSDYLYEVTKFIQSIKDLPKGFNLGDLIWDIENLLDEVKETRVNSYKVQHLRNLYNEYEKNYSDKDFTPSPEGASLGEQINNVYEFISSSFDVTKKTEEDLKDEARAILSRAIDPNTGEIREDLYINLVGKENFERILEDLEKISDRKTWREEMKKLNEEENNFISKVEKIRKHYDLNYANQQYWNSNNFENLSPIEQLNNLYSVVSKCESIFDVHEDTVKALRKNIEIFIEETWNARDKVLELSGTLNTEILKELNTVKEFAERSGIPFVARLNKVPNNPKVAEIFDSLLKTSRKINTTNDLSNKDAKEFKEWSELLARNYYNPRLGAFEVPGAKGINGRQIIDVCKNSGIKLKVGDNNPVTQKNNIEGRFNKLAWVLNRASSVDDLTDLEGIKKELQDLVDQFYNAKEKRFVIPVTELRENKMVVVETVLPPNVQKIIDECERRLGIKLKIDVKELSEKLSNDQKFLYLEKIARKINNTDDLTETGKKVVESEGTKLIKFLQTIKNSVNSEQYKKYVQLYNRSELKRVYENSMSWPIIYFSPDKEMSQMGKIDYFAKVLKMHFTNGRKFEDPNDSEENFEGKRRTDAHEDFIYDVLKLGDTHYNAKTGEFKITDGSYDKVTDEENAKYNINTVKNFYKIITIGDSNTQIEAMKLIEYNSSNWTLAGTAQNLVKQLEEEDWNWAKFSPETLPNLISDLRKVVSRIERGINELYYLNDAWFGTNENRSIESKDLKKLIEVLDDYNSWL